MAQSIWMIWMCLKEVNNGKKIFKKSLKPVRPQLGDGVEILNAGSVLEDPITRTLETNYMPYAMSVIVSRALPEIDGFKPAHRKLLYTMYEMGLLKGARTKSANIGQHHAPEPPRRRRHL